MKKTFTLIVALCCAAGLLSQTTVTGTIQHEGVERRYRLRVPDGTAGERPLVFNLHGFGSNAFEQEVYAQMNAIADTAGFFVCYPDGLENSWNVGWGFGSTADDVGFISALIDTLSADYAIDSKRVYSCGMSNGGFMSYRLACELNDKIAAIASVTGSMAPAYLEDCNPGRPVPVLEIHGTADDVVPYDGAEDLSVPINALMEFWADNNNCGSEPSVEELPDVESGDSSTVAKVAYPDCEAGLQVLHFRVNGGGHTWPGSGISIGVTNQDINASLEIWRFFQLFSLDGLTNTGGAIRRPAFSPPFPNPTAGELMLNLAAEGRISVYDSRGQLLQRQVQPAGTAEIDLSQLADGMYLIRLETMGASKAFSVMKQ